MCIDGGETAKPRDNKGFVAYPNSGDNGYDGMRNNSIHRFHTSDGFTYTFGQKSGHMTSYWGANPWLRYNSAFVSLIVKLSTDGGADLS